MPRRYTTVAAEIGAKISSLPIVEGASFKAGDALVAFDCSLQKAQLDKSRAELVSAEHTLNSNERLTALKLDKARAELESAEHTVNSHEKRTALKLDKARAELEAVQHTLTSNQRLAALNSVGQLELDLSRAAVSRAKAEVGAGQAIISKCSVAAPFNGRVAEQKARDQQFVQLGQPLLDIIDDSVLELEFLVPSAWLRWMRVGGALRVQIDETRKTYPARFIRVGARVDPVSQSIKVVAAIEGQHADLMAGMSGRVIAAPAGTKN